MIRCLTRTGLLAIVFSFCACQEKPRAQLYFRDLAPPLGIGKVTVVSDVNLNLSTGGEATVLVAVEPEIDRDDLDLLMNAFYRQVKERRGFQTTDTVKKIILRFYASEAKAKIGGEDWLAQLSRPTVHGEPILTNQQKVPLLKWAHKALGKQPEFTGKLKPLLLADPSSLSLDVTVPFVADDGSGKYVESLSYVKAITELVAYTRTLFDKIPSLQKLTFIGQHNDGIVMKIWLTRPQYERLNLGKVEESLGAFQGQFIEPLMSKQISEKAVEEKTIQQRRKVYRETLARLPKEQVELAPDLR